jgi:RNA polymerase sigma factor (sigma-70 family)
MAATALDWRTRRSAMRRPVLGADDHRLVARVRAGDDLAFEAIYDRYSRGLLAFCRHMLASREEAEDALQHSFGAAYRMLRDSDRDVQLRPWLYTIARNRCLSLLRSRRQDLSLDGVPDLGSEGDGLVDQVQRRTDLRELVEDLRRLPGDQRAALVLFELGGLPHDEIAVVLDVRRDKVKALIFQAREGLIRARQARDLPCTEMREQLSTLAGKVPSRSMLRRHVERCPSCSVFEAQVGRQRAGLALILPVLPTAGLKSLVLGSAVGRGAAVAGGGAGAGGGAAVLGGAGAGGGGLAGATAGGAAGLAGAGAGAGAAGSSAALAGAAAGGVSGTLATAGGAGTIAAALGAKGASVVVVKLLAVVAAGGAVASVGAVGQRVAGEAPPALHQGAPSPVSPSSAIQGLLAGSARPGTETPVDPGGVTTPAAVRDALPLTGSEAVLPLTATVQTASPAPAGGSPTTGAPTSGPAPAPAPTQTPAAGQPEAADTPPATQAPAPAPTTTTVAATPMATSTETTMVAGATPDAPAPAGAPADGQGPGATGEPVTGGAAGPASDAPPAADPSPAPEPARPLPDEPSPAP